MHAIAELYNPKNRNFIENLGSDESKNRALTVIRLRSDMQDKKPLKIDTLSKIWGRMNRS